MDNEGFTYAKPNGIPGQHIARVHLRDKHNQQIIPQQQQNIFMNGYGGGNNNEYAVVNKRRKHELANINETTLENEMIFVNTDNVDLAPR